MPELDGLRGIAILMVFLLHYIAESHSHDGNFGPLYRFAQIFRLGWSGVDLFFVLSGFLIGGILLDSQSGLHYFKPFYTRRLHRIVPVYFAWITVFGVAGHEVSNWSPSYAATFGQASVPLWIYYLFLQNLVFWHVSEFTRYWMAPTWSLAVEEQFYLVSPWLIRYLSLRRLTQFLVACVIGAPILRYVLYPHSPGTLGMYYVLTPCRADALAVGMLAAVAWRTSARTWLAHHITFLKLASGALLLGALAMVKWLPAPGNAIEAALQYSWLAVLYACLMVLALLHPRGLFARLLQWRFLREWGRISYCVYLIHFGILSATHWAILHSAPRISDWPGAFTTLLAAAVTWGFAQLSWRFFEKPLIDRGHLLSKAQLQSSAAVQRHVGPDAGRSRLSE